MNNSVSPPIVQNMNQRHRVRVVCSLLRVKQWTKNGFLFAGIIFARQLWYPEKISKVMWTFLAFCLLSSSLYIFNDWLDVEQDRNHPQKKNRPLASGAIKISMGLSIMIILAVAGLALSYWLGPLLFIIAVVYAGLTISYSCYLKRIAIVDVMVLAAGFVLRAVAGAVVIQVPISPWLLVCTLLLSLFLALTKRRQELQFNQGMNSREVLKQYTIGFLDQAITIVTAATLTGYFFYTFSAHTQWLMITIPFVLYGLFRYLLLSQVKGSGEEPEQVLLSDRSFIINLVLWVLSCIIILYLV